MRYHFFVPSDFCFGMNYSNLFNILKKDQWIRVNRLKLNQDKTQFIWLGTPHQLSKLQLQTITLVGVDVMISTEAMCLGVSLDSKYVSK